MSRVGPLIAGAAALCVAVSAGAAPDALRGEQLYARCHACHATRVELLAA